MKCRKSLNDINILFKFINTKCGQVIRSDGSTSLHLRGEWETGGKGRSCLLGYKKSKLKFLPDFFMHVLKLVQLNA